MRSTSVRYELACRLAVVVDVCSRPEPKCGAALSRAVHHREIVDSRHKKSTLFVLRQHADDSTKLLDLVATAPAASSYKLCALVAFCRIADALFYGEPRVGVEHVQEADDLNQAVFFSVTRSNSLT